MGGIAMPSAACESLGMTARRSVSKEEAPATAPSQGREKRYRGTESTVCETDEPAQHRSHGDLTGYLSAARLAPYARDGAAAAVAIRRHEWNLLICESLYPTLQLLEVVLRNRLLAAFDAVIGPEWMSGVGIRHSDRCEQELGRARDRVAKRKPLHIRDDWVAELGLGFWCALHAAHYEQPALCGRAPFPGLIKRVYPGMPKSRHSLRAIKSDLERLRRLRNRVFHHERILHWVDLDDQVRVASQYLAWMGEPPDLAHRTLSRYHEVRAQQSADPIK